MCKPTHFSIDYVINPWMKVGSVDKKRANFQWTNLLKTITNQNIKVDVIEQQVGLPDMVFTADQAVIKDKNLVLSSFHFQQRRGETKHYQTYFEKKNFNIFTLPKNYFFEGSGECIWYGSTLFVGTGFRNSPNICKFLTKFLKVDVICLNLVNPKFYHLDTCFFVLNKEVAFYYPPAFSKKSENILKSKIKTLIPITHKEASNFAANSLVTDHHVITQKGNEEFKKEIENMGYKVIETNVSEFMKSGGGIHCLVQTLEEKYVD